MNTPVQPAVVMAACPPVLPAPPLLRPALPDSMVLLPVLSPSTHTGHQDPTANIGPLTEPHTQNYLFLLRQEAGPAPRDVLHWRYI